MRGAGVATLRRSSRAPYYEPQPVDPEQFCPTEFALSKWRRPTCLISCYATKRETATPTLDLLLGQWRQVDSFRLAHLCAAKTSLNFP